MKFKKFFVMMSAIFILSGLAGCALEEKLDAVEDRIEEAAESVVQTAPTQSTSVSTTSAAALTKEQAQAIALEYAGFSADQVSRLRTEYEIDDGVAQYDVSFYEGSWEYEFEIDAETGKILSYDKDREND